MTDIEVWMERFRNRWESQEVENVLELFTEEVEYYETPSDKLGWEEIIREWRGVKEQDEISLEYEIFCSKGDKNTVKWKLSYLSNGEKINLKGIYLIKLNENGKCYEFWQYCQAE